MTGVNRWLCGTCLGMMMAGTTPALAQEAAPANGPAPASPAIGCARRRRAG